MTDLTTARAPGQDEPDLPPDVPEPREPRVDGPPSADGLALTRLLSLARLTPPQALELGAAVVAEAAGRRDPDTGGAEDGRVVVEQAVVGADGRVALGTPADGGRDGRPGPDLGAVLADVAAAARLRARRSDPAAERLLAPLDRAAADLAIAGVPAVARDLTEAADALDRAAVRAELAALVRAARGAAAPGTGAGAPVSPQGRRGAAAAGRAGGRAGGGAGRRIGAWLLSVLVLAGVVTLEVVLLRDDIATDIALLLDAGRSGSEPSAAPEPDGLPVVPPAPAAAGAVAGVDLRPLAACAPDAPCDLRLLVELVPGPEAQVVTWSYRVVDRCTGATETAPGGTVTVPAGGTRAAAVGTLPLPAHPAVAVIAVTDAPAAAASAPVLVGSCRPDPGTR
ncbi:hypothetical protein ACI784_23115 [Geodermatophilus sp. SYSU D01186]